MAVTYDGAVLAGPEPDAARFHTVTMPSTPAGDFAMFALVRLDRMYLDNPSGTTASVIGLAASGTGSTGGNDCYIRVLPLNTGPTGAGGKLVVRMSKTNGFFATTSITGTSQFAVDDRLLVVIQSRGGNAELRTCKVGSGAVVVEHSSTRNASWTTKALGDWRVGNGWANTFQAWGMANRSFSDAEIVALADGADPESIIASGDRAHLTLFNTLAASIPATWGTAPAVQSGDFSKSALGSPIVPNAAQRIAVTNEPPIYGAVSINDNGTNPVWTIKGTATGYTPTAMQGRLVAQDGSTVQDWADLANFTASAGTWQGDLSVPAGGLYRVETRDKQTPSIVWRGSRPFICGAVIGSLGQSPYVWFEATYPLDAAPVTALAFYKPNGINQIQRVTTGSIGAGLAKALNDWHARTGKPILCVFAAVTGTSSTQWASKDAGIWPPLLAAMDYVRPQRILFSWLNGAAEGGNPIATIKANHDTILANLDADVATARGVSFRYRMLTHNRDTGNTSTNAKNRQAQQEWATQHPLFGSKVLLGPWWGDMQTDAESTGTAQAATSNTITLKAAEAAGGTGYEVAITGGTGAGQVRTIASGGWNATTKVATLTAAWTTIPDATSTYALYHPTSGSPHPALDGVLRFSARYAIDTAHHFGLSSASGRGPTAVAATYPNGGDGSVINVRHQHRAGTALRTRAGGTTALGVAGFIVGETDTFATVRTITDARIVSADTVRLTLDQPVASRTAARVSFGRSNPVKPADFGKQQAGGLDDLPYDNSGIDPTMTGGHMAEFVSALAITDAPVAPPPPVGGVIRLGERKRWRPRRRRLWRAA